MRRLLTNVSLIVLGALLIGCSAESLEMTTATVRPVKLLEITDRSADLTRVFPAKVAATKQAKLAFRLSGHLVDFSLHEGDTVTKGTVLARLDNRDARNTLLHREADYQLAAADFKRKDQLLRRKLISQADYDLAKAQVKSARASLASGQDQLSYTDLIAPYDGIVAKVLVDNYQMVQAGQSILVLQEGQYLDVKIQVPESFVNNLQHFKVNAQGQASVRFAINPDLTLPVKLKEYSSQITPGTQSYEVVFTLPQPEDMAVLPGMSAEVIMDIPASQSSTVAAILPVNAIMKRDHDGKSVVWIFDTSSGTVNSRQVSLGKVTNKGIEVTHGVRGGDKVVVAGVQFLAEGLNVKPLRRQRGV
ncbi:efflux RND transporter periplasmic adaptor subunit [Motilimonas cestriensis]|uniref:Efflux RND transporter periplasmic adaptor subunit n=1 Tax=Motilimonas cestriensis TaxID=2742685 RepID=A0ABS8WCM6_9GAMM|nr:efflux RND transporter periplasmic adaptor subunit [Motilimonas cestriensis]MCE2596791.1 efflux RND transporter periplasmic adaptor subunit [Motilimonas cestriensis]